MSAGDQAFAGRAAVWAANIRDLDWAQLSWTVQPLQSIPTADRRHSSATAAWVQLVTVRWALSADAATAEEDLWLTFVDEPFSDPESPGATLPRLASDSDGRSAVAAVPIWLQQPVRLHRSGSVLVLSDADDAATWLAEARSAQMAVARGAAERRRPQGHDHDGGPLVVELPQSRAVFERILGVQPGSYATVAAAAWPMGPDLRSAPIHVVVNPEATDRLSAVGRGVLLTHEAVHVATRSPGSPAPTWLVEGYADRIAYLAHPTAAAPAEGSLRDAVRDQGVPRHWPSEEEFAPDAPDLSLSYDLAWSAVRSIAEARGEAALDQLYAAVDGGASIDEAARVIGTTEAALRHRWRADLGRLTR